MVTWANDHYYDFVMNWVTHLKKLNVWLSLANLLLSD